MKKLIILVIVISMMALLFAVPAFANPPTPACKGLDVAHDQIHDSATQGELQLHALRDANHCGH